MITKILITLGLMTIGIGLPILEINDTHVFNPDWTPHARIHEVWQLITNTSFALLCAYLVWIKNWVRLPSLIGLLVTGGFLTAFALRGTYGGSMKYLDGSEKTVLGINIGLLGFGIVSAIFVVILVREYRQGAKA